MPSPTWANVVLRLTCDGTNGSTTFTDLSAAAHTVTAGGNAQVSTAQSKWGGASLYLDGTAGTYLSIASSGQFNFGTSAWMFACWVRPGADTFVDGAALFNFFNSVTHYMTEGIVDIDGQPAAYDSDEGAISGNAATAFIADTWHHVAFSYDGTTLRGFVDGVVGLSQTAAINFTSSRALRIGGAYQQNTETWPALLLYGYIDDIVIAKGEAFYTSAFTPPTGPYDTSGGIDPVEGYSAADTMLGEPSVLGQLFPIGYASDSGPLQAPSVLGQHDYTGLIGDLLTRWAMDLVTPGGDVRVPIGSWQSTLQTGQQSYVQCVVPACSAWLDSINAATEFAISRIVVMPDDRTIEQEMARAPVDTVSLAEGGYNYSATISGYSDAFAAGAQSSYPRTLTALRTVFSYSGRLRVRCGIDWLLRPGQQAVSDGDEFSTGYISYYVNADDQYMDVGEAEA